MPGMQSRENDFFHKVFVQQCLENLALHSSSGCNYVVTAPPIPKSPPTSSPSYFVPNEITKSYIVFITFILLKNGFYPSLLSHDTNL